MVRGIERNRGTAENSTIDNVPAHGGSVRTDSDEPNRFEAHPKATLSVILVAIVALAEIALRILAHQGVVTYYEFPTRERPTFWNDIAENFGVWHYPNASIVHRSPCFEVTYRSNSHGARDVERSIESTAAERIVVIGDSFVEGYGVERHDRMTDILERKTGYEHLNFGTAANFGSIQEWLLYETFASNFDHSQVFVFFLPDNDFLENRPGEEPNGRYRPHLRKVDGEFEVYYLVDFDPDRPASTLKPSKIRKNRFYNGSYIVNVIRQFHRNVNRKRKQNRRVSYDDFTDEDAEVLLYSYRKIVEHAGSREVTFFIIPRPMDFDAYDRRGYDFRIVPVMEEFAARYSNVETVDLLPYFVAYAEREGVSYDDFHHSCDGHWSRLGNRVAAEAVIEAVDRPGAEDSPR
jgi:hypothetical protein